MLNFKIIFILVFILFKAKTILLAQNIIFDNNKNILSKKNKIYIYPKNKEDSTKAWMVTDRPHIAETPHLTEKNYLQFELGTQYQKTSENMSDYTYKTSLFRYGISQRVEARLELEYLGQKEKTQDTTTLKHGFGGVTLGSKIALIKAQGIIPETALLYHVSLPFWGSQDFRPKNTATEIKFLFLNRITKFYEFEYNFGLQTGEDTGYSYALNNEFEINKNLYFFAEVYGFFRENNNANNQFNGKFAEDHRFNFGVWYLFNADTQLDLSGGFGLNDMAPQHYVALGFSKRIKIRK